MTTIMRRLATAGLLALIASSVVAPQASAAKNPKPDLVWYLGSPTRTVIELGDNGPSVGDITVAYGEMSEVQGKDVIGTYANTQITIRTNLPGGREIRDVDLSLTVPGGAIYATALIKANAGAPPTQAQVFAIIGGTGKYESVSGQAIHSGFTATGSKISLYFSD